MLEYVKRKKRKILIVAIVISVVLVFIRLTINSVFGSFTYLNVSCAIGCTPCVYLFLLLGANPNQHVEDETGTGHFEAPLGIAAERNSPITIRLLVAYGGKVNDKIDYAAPLLWAVFDDNYAASKALLELGADPNVTGDIGDMDGWTPLHFARYRHNKKIEQLLLEHHAVMESANW